MAVVVVVIVIAVVAAVTAVVAVTVVAVVAVVTIVTVVAAVAVVTLVTTAAVLKSLDLNALTSSQGHCHYRGRRSRHGCCRTDVDCAHVAVSVVEKSVSSTVTNCSLSRPRLPKNIPALEERGLLILKGRDILGPV